MNTKAIHRCLIVVLSAAASCLAGPTERPSSGNLFIDAGFQVRKAETVEQRQLYGTAPSYRVLKAGTPWHNFYVYKDEGNYIAYVGDEGAYERFQQLAAQEGYRYGFYLARDMELDPAWRWSEAFGPVRHVWTCRRHYPETYAK